MNLLKRLLNMIEGQEGSSDAHVCMGTCRHALFASKLLDSCESRSLSNVSNENYHQSHQRRPCSHHHHRHHQLCVPGYGWKRNILLSWANLVVTLLLLLLKSQRLNIILAKKWFGTIQWRPSIKTHTHSFFRINPPGVNGC